MTDVPTPAPADPAKRRFMLLAAVRISGLALAVIGLLLARSNVFGAPNEAVGRIMVLIGLLGSLIVPTMMLRRWRTGERRP